MAKNPNTIFYVIGGVVAAAALGITGYFVLKPKTDENSGENGGGVDGGGTVGGGSGTNPLDVINKAKDTATTALDIADQIKAATTTPAGALISDVHYIAARNENGAVTDASVMEIRLKKENSNVKVGDTITLTGAGAAYDGTFPVVEISGTAGNAKAVMVKKTSGLGATALWLPSAKVYAGGTVGFRGQML